MRDGRENQEVPGQVRNATLDGLRGVAIILVLVCHSLSLSAADIGPEFSWVKRLFTFTFGGVELFFVLSGFLIGKGLVASRAAGNQKRVFYLRRAARILPVYCILLGSYFVARSFTSLFGVSSVYFSSDVPLWTYFLFLQNNLMGGLQSLGPWWLAVTWSLAVEEQFYLLAPWLMRCAGPVALAGLAVGSTFFCPALRHYLFHTTGNQFGATYLTLGRIDSLMIGVTVAALLSSETHAKQLSHLRPALPWLVATLTLAFFLLPFGLAGASMFVVVWAPTLLGLGFGVVLLWLLLSPDTWVARALQTRFWTFMGDTSYFTYLFHFPALFTVHAIFQRRFPDHQPYPKAAVTLLALAATLLMAAASRRWLELPVIRWARRYRYQPALA